MKEFGGTIGICKASQDVCKGVVLVCKKKEGLQPAIDELKESLFVSF
jgi:hypothetical protein